MFRRALTAIIVVAVCRQTASASGTAVTSAGYGLTLVLSTEWLDGAGYRPVRVTINAPVPTKADQTMHLEFHTYSYYSGGMREMVVARDVEIPAGSTEVADTIAIPQIFPLQSFKLEVWIDGRYKSKLGLNSYVGGMANEGLPNVLVVAKPLTARPAGFAPPTILAADPDSSLLGSVFPADVNVQQNYWGAPRTAAGPGPPPLQSLITVPANFLPRRWIELSGLDIVCISIGDLEQLATAEPDRFRALRDWTAAGGNLIVSDVGASFESLDKLSKRLAGYADPSESAWSRPKASDYGDRLNGPYTNFGAQQTLAALPMPQDAPFMLRPLGTGMVIAAATDDLFKQPAQHWVWMLNSLGSDRWLWYRRHGMSLQRKNGDFWNWVVRGVGLAPVTEFRVLITGFVLIIGPLNYFWLRRRGKLHLLVVIVPLAALTVTMGLFGYAIIADGLDVRVRARTYTRLDQRSGQAVCWSRISYYAGLAPAGGLIFPEDTMAMPLTSNDGDANNMSYHQKLVWSPGKQELVSGWLPSRTPTQYLTVRSRRSEAGLRLFPAGKQTGPQIENQLGTRVVRLLLADAEGRHYGASDIAAGARSVLNPVDPAEERSAIQELVDDRKPGVPQGFVAPSEALFQGRRRYFGVATTGAVSGTSLGTNRLEAGVRDVVMGADKQASMAGRAPLAPRTYIAIVERSPEVAFGVDDPREEDSLHVVEGQW